MVIAGARRAASKFRPVRAFSPLGLRIRDEGVPSSRIPSPDPPDPRVRRPLREDFPGVCLIGKLPDSGSPAKIPGF